MNLKPMYLLVAFVLGVALYAAKVHANPLYTHEDGGLVINLMSSQCSDPTSALMIAMSPKEIQDGEWKNIESVWPMQNGSKMPFAGCWREVPKDVAFAITNGKVNEVSFLMVFSDQKGMLMTKKQFMRKKGQIDT